MNYDEQECRPTVAGQPIQAYPQASARPHYTNPTVVIPVPPPSYQYWPGHSVRTPVSALPHGYNSNFQPQPPQQYHQHVQQFLQQPPYRSQNLPGATNGHGQFPQPHYPQLGHPQRPPNGTPQVHNPQHQPAKPRKEATTPKKQKAVNLEAHVSEQHPRVSVNGVHKPIITPDLPVDYRLLLLSLSEYYIGQARSLCSLIAHHRQEADVELYYKMMATGVGALETVLKKFSANMPPRQVAILQLRYATLLYEDTENDLEAESMLTKGTAFCERNRLLDLKYSMQHLLARLMYKSNAKASLKYLDSSINDAMTCQHIVWVYAFRFLRVSLLMQHSSTHDIVATMQDLTWIEDTAKRRGDSAMIVMAAMLEALTRLQSRDVDAVNEAQRAIAAARAEQMNSALEGLPQLNSLVQFADLACSLAPYNHEQAVKKMGVMQTYLDQIMGSDNWSRDGSFAVPLSRPAQEGLTTNTGGIFVKDSKGYDCLAFSWLSRPDVYLIGFLLSGQAVYFRNHQNRGAEKFLAEGHKMTDDSYQVNEAPTNLSMPRAFARTRFRLVVRCYLLLQQTFCLFERSAWDAARVSLEAFTEALGSLHSHAPSDLHRCAIYLDAVSNHSSGNLDAALMAYQHPDLELPESAKGLTSPTHESLAILATMNSLLIVRQPHHPYHKQTAALMSRLERYFPTTTSSSAITQSQANHHLHSYHELHLALTSSTLTSTKKHLKASLELANAVSSAPLRTLVLSYLASAFFNGQTGNEARQHVLGARAAARQSGSKLWAAAADGMVAELLEREGRGDEAGKLRGEGEALAAGLGRGLKAILEGHQSGTKWIGKMDDDDADDKTGMASL